MGRPVKAETVVLWLCIALVAIAGLAPIAAIAVESFRHNGHFSLNYYRELISAARFWPMLGNSIRLALATTGVCGLIGVPAGILFAKSDLPLRSGFMWLLTVPFVLPPYFVALGWARVIARIGASASDWLFGFGGCVVVLSSVFLPITMLLTFASSSNVDRRLEEAARLVSGWPEVLRRVTLPLSAPGIVFSLVLVFLLAMGELSVPSFLRYPVLPVLSFTQFAASYNFGAATAAAVPLAAIAFVGVLVESAFLRDRDYRFQSTGQTLFISLRHWKNPLAALMAALCFALVILPLAALFGDAFSLAGMHEAMQRAGASAVRSVMYSAVAATILMALGFLLGQLMLSRPRERPILNFLTLALFAIPGTVLSIGLVRLWNTPSTSFIYATPALLILGYTAQYCAVTTRLSLAGLMLIPISLDEAGRLSGAMWVRRLFRISIPLSARTLVCAWLAAYILCLRDVPIALMTAPPGGDPLSARILTLMANGAPPMIASLCLIMAIASLIPLAILARVIPSRGLAT
jgi:iron(III) transport system permease protein